MSRPFIHARRTAPATPEKPRCFPIQHRLLSAAISAVLAGGFAIGIAKHAHSQSFPVAVPLETLDGSNGYRLNVSGEFHQAGFATAIAGDINGDGIDDLLIGAPRSDANGLAAGSAYLVFGQADSPASVYELGDLDGSNGVRLDGPSGSLTGRSVSGVGDVNGDGYDDFLVGAPGASGYAGAGFVVFGRASPFPPALDLTTLNGSDGFRLQGAIAYSQAGRSGGRAGDINGDGIDDIVIGQPLDGPGSAFVVFGRDTATSGAFPAIVQLADVDGSNGFRIDGVPGDDRAANSVAGNGDINGDGIDDLVIGAYFSSVGGTAQAGRAYVVFGSASTFPAVLPLADLDGSDGFRLDAESFREYAGSSVSIAGDLNGDGFDDIAIGAYGKATNGSLSGAAYVVFGKSSPWAAVTQLGALDGNDGFRVDGVQGGERVGRALSWLGDINGDGFGDLAIGAPGAFSDGVGYAGSVYVLFGHGGPFDASVDPGDFNGANGFRIDGADDGSGTGRSIAGGGDVNGDGFADLIIGAPGSNSNGISSSGAGFAVFGGITGPGLVPAIAVSTETLEFGAVSLGSTKTVSLQVDNPGSGALTVSALSIAGADSDRFSIELENCSGGPVGPGSFCTIDLGFSPAVPGEYTATLQIDSNAPTGPILITLAGSSAALFADGFESL